MAPKGEPYTAARRHTSKSVPRRFEPDHCANCMMQLPPQIERLFCSELCRQTADVIRYWRGISRAGRIEQPEVRLALTTRIAHLPVGSYAEQARRLSPPRATRSGNETTAGAESAVLPVRNSITAGLGRSVLLARGRTSGRPAVRNWLRTRPVNASAHRDLRCATRHRPRCYRRPDRDSDATAAAIRGLPRSAIRHLHSRDFGVTNHVMNPPSAKTNVCSPAVPTTVRPATPRPRG